MAGRLSVCGMALEPLVPITGDSPDPERRDMQRRLSLSTVLAVPLLVMGMVDITFPGAVWAQLALATPVVLWGGAPFFKRGWQSLKNQRLNMFSLIALGTGIAYVYSLTGAVFPDIFPVQFRTMDGGVPLYFEAAAVIVALVLLGQVLELRARALTGGAIRALLGLAPRTARRVADDGNEADVALGAVAVGDRLRVRPGEKLPVDGPVVDGGSAVNDRC